MKKQFSPFFLIISVLFLFRCTGEAGTYEKSNNNNLNNNTGDAEVDTINEVPCPDGIDEDGDGYGEGCPMGPDCNDSVAAIHPGAVERCNGFDDNCNDEIDEGVLNACGNCSTRCDVEQLGLEPFPMEDTDPNAETEGTGLDENGDIILSEEDNDFFYLWTANTNDMGRGTVSKVDTRNVKEVARYFSVTCWAKPSLYLQQGICRDVNNNDVQLNANSPSRTAVDFNFDVWVANRAFSGQPSVTKIASKRSNCIDRNGDGVIQTSEDQDGDGNITTDCDGDGLPDNISTVCTNGLPPEFYGMDDECVLFTTNYAVTNQLGRSVCLDKGNMEVGASNVWVGTYSPSSANPISQTNNIFYKIDGATGQFLGYQILPSGITPYGCAVDQDGILWVSSWGLTTFIDTVNSAYPVGPVLSVGSSQMYGITIDDQKNVWFGGWGSSMIYRYRPNRIDYNDADYYNQLAAGAWTRIQHSNLTAGIAADTRGYVWTADNSNGYILRVNQDLLDGDYDSSVITIMNPGNSFGGNMRGVGIDFDGNVWGISHDISRASKIQLTPTGDATGAVQTTYVGTNPYTYSDFTGYGLHKFTRPQGIYTYTFTACEGALDPPTWFSVDWSSTEPSGTNIDVYVQSSNVASELNSAQQYGPWETSPADLSELPGPVSPNPAWYIKVTFLLSTDVRDITPILHDFDVTYDCPTGSPEK
ncbi:MAG: hypothetical protein JXR95_12375 [Deltaproteobacteria bacterium]|nr:hypothetical protein [Deltaproteobacteria bacterium]